jgi:histone H3/H4
LALESLFDEAVKTLEKEERKTVRARDRTIKVE